MPSRRRNTKHRDRKEEVSTQSTSEGEQKSNEKADTKIQPVSRRQHISALAKMVYAAASSGEVHALSSLLSALSDDDISQIFRTCSRCGRSILMIAVRRGHRHIVEYLLDNFSDFFDVSYHRNQGRSAMTALSLAAMKGRWKMVQLLLNRGADIDHIDRRHGTALHTACLYGHLKIVKCLLEKGASPDIADSRDNTCIMAACMKDQAKIVKLLLQAGVDPNMELPDNRTALHVAAEWDAVHSVQVLLKHGALLSTTVSGQSLLIQAILEGSHKVAGFLLNLSEISRGERVEGLELMGALCIYEGNVEDAFKHWCRAMVEKCRDAPDVLSMTCCYPAPAVLNIAESRTMDELMSRQHDLLVQRIESLLIFERLGTPRKGMIYFTYASIFHRLRSSGHYGEALSVWNRGWKASGTYFGANSFYNNAHDMLCNLLEQSTLLEFAVIIETMNLLVHQIEINPMKCKRHCTQLTRLRTLLVVLAYMSTASSDDLGQIKDLVRRFVRVDSPVCFERPLLHCIIGLVNTHKYGSVKEFIPGLVALILECAADIDAIDREGRTSLHEVALCRNDANIAVACSITRHLLDMNAHMDALDKYGQTALDLANQTVKSILLECYPLPLKCLAASVIIECNVPYKNRAPVLIKHFIKLHLPRQIQ